MQNKRDLSDSEWRDIGDRIRTRRRSLGIKQSELAESIDISTTHMSSIENGRQHPSIYVLIRISEQLNTTPDFFLLGAIRSNNIPMNIIDSIKLCNEEHLPLIHDIIGCFLPKS